MPWALAVKRWIRHKGPLYGCMQGSIDQVDGLLCFDADVEGLKQWDEQIASICYQLNGLLESAADKGLPVTAQ